jgi:hypothetical protein
MTTTITSSFVLEKETKGTFKFKEVDTAGQDAGAWGKVGTLYMRKTAFAQGVTPKTIKATFEVE